MVGSGASFLTPALFLTVELLYNYSSHDALPHSDTNEDGVLDEQELEALFTKEVRNPAVHHWYFPSASI